MITIAAEENRNTAMGEEYPLGYLAGNIMGFGDRMARGYEYARILASSVPGDVYSPVLNKSINDKANVTEEENNALAEKITDADVERLWNSDYVVICPEQNAIGTLCELGCLYGWRYMADRIKAIADGRGGKSDGEVLREITSLVNRMADKKIFAHYDDIRTNHLNEKDWRRSFSINQLLYGMILGCASDGRLHETFDEIVPILEDVFSESRREETEE